MLGVKAFTGAAVSVLLFSLFGPYARLGRHDRGGAGARLSGQSAVSTHSARKCASPMRERAAGAGRAIAEVAVTASAGYQYTDTLSTQGGNADNLVKTNIHGANPRAASGHRHADNLQRQQTATEPERPRVRFPARAKR